MPSTDPRRKKSSQREPSLVRAAPRLERLVIRARARWPGAAARGARSSSPRSSRSFFCWERSRAARRCARSTTPTPRRRLALARVRRVRPKEEVSPRASVRPSVRPSSRLTLSPSLLPLTGEEPREETQPEHRPRDQAQTRAVRRRSARGRLAVRPGRERDRHGKLRHAMRLPGVLRKRLRRRPAGRRRGGRREREDVPVVRADGVPNREVTTRGEGRGDVGRRGER